MEDNRLFMIEFDLPEILDEEFMGKIPAQRAVIHEMMREGEIKAYSLALDRSRLWAIMEAPSEWEIWERLERFPLREYMKPCINELMFHNAAETVLQFSLN